MGPLKTTGPTAAAAVPLPSSPGLVQEVGGEEAFPRRQLQAVQVGRFVTRVPSARRACADLLPDARNAGPAGQILALASRYLCLLRSHG